MNLVANGDHTIKSLYSSNMISVGTMVQDPEKFEFMHLHISTNILVNEPLLSYFLRFESPNLAYINLSIPSL